MHLCGQPFGSTATVADQHPGTILVDTETHTHRYMHDAANKTQDNVNTCRKGCSECGLGSPHKPEHHFTRKRILRSAIPTSCKFLFHHHGMTVVRGNGRCHYVSGGNCYGHRPSKRAPVATLVIAADIGRNSPTQLHKHLSGISRGLLVCFRAHHEEVREHNHHHDASTRQRHEVDVCRNPSRRCQYDATAAMECRTLWSGVPQTSRIPHGTCHHACPRTRRNIRNTEQACVCHAGGDLI